MFRRPCSHSLQSVIATGPRRHSALSPRSAPAASTFCFSLCARFSSHTSCAPPKKAGPPDVGRIFKKLIACDLVASWRASRLVPQVAASIKLACDETDYQRYSTCDRDSLASASDRKVKFSTRSRYSSTHSPLLSADMLTGMNAQQCTALDSP